MTKHDEPVACPFVAWFEVNHEELAKYQDEFVLVDLDRGVVAHGKSWEKFLASEATVSEADRRRCMRAHASLSAARGRERDDRGIKAYARGRAREHLDRVKMSTGGMSDANVRHEFIHAVECERQAADMRRHFDEHRALDPEKSDLLFESCDRLLALGDVLLLLDPLTKRDDLPPDAAEVLKKAAEALRAGLHGDSPRAKRRRKAT